MTEIDIPLFLQVRGQVHSNPEAMRHQYGSLERAVVQEYWDVLEETDPGSRIGKDLTKIARYSDADDKRHRITGAVLITGVKIEPLGEDQNYFRGVIEFQAKNSDEPEVVRTPLLGVDDPKAERDADTPGMALLRQAKDCKGWYVLLYIFNEGERKYREVVRIKPLYPAND